MLLNPLRKRPVTPWAAEGEAKYDDLERKLAAAPDIAVPAITHEGDANGAPHLDPSSYQCWPDEGCPLSGVKRT
jgi:hypothetical protein